MAIIKKLDLFILKKFALIFVGAFFICLFVFMMQFTWRYVDELIGKGLSLEILAQFYWYMGITLIPTSLPLAILLASLITFGNLGEQLELLAMKAAGVPLIRIMKPIFVVVFLLASTSFVFQNYMSPQAQISLRTLLFSMKQTSPAVEIPEGVFYSGVPNINLYVQHKNAETGMLYEVIIYKTDQGFDRAQIVLADSAKIEVTADKMHLKLELWNGEQFQNLQDQGAMGLNSASVPYDRETFFYKQLVIDFDSNFSMMDAETLRNMATAKNMNQIEASIDSVNRELDSVGSQFYTIVKKDYVPLSEKNDSVGVASIAQSNTIEFDSIFATLPADSRMLTMRQAAENVRTFCSELEWKRETAKYGGRFIRLHEIEWHQKMTLSLACLFFFFIGAPLGAIIRKGGLGMPTVVSIIIFIVYYLINTSGMKMARDGSWNMWYGMWVSTLVLMPFGAFVTYKANKDSVVFNMEVYVEFFKNLLGIRNKRNIFKKEVIINDPNYEDVLIGLQELREKCIAYREQNKLMMAPNYVNIFFKSKEDKDVMVINEQLESLVEILSNSRDARILQELNQLPILFVDAHTSPCSSVVWNRVLGALFPIGLIIWGRIWHSRLRLLLDLQQIEKSSSSLELFIKKIEH